MANSIKRIVIILGWLGFSSGLGSCILTLRPINYTYELPAPVPVEMPAKIALVNRFDPEKLSEDKEKLEELYSLGTAEVIKGLQTSFDADDNFELTVLEEKGDHGMNHFAGYMDRVKVVDHLYRSGADYLLVLEFFNSEFDIENIVEEDEDGSKSRTNEVYLIVTTGFSMYDRNGELIDEAQASKTKHYQSRMALSSIIIIGPNMKNAGEDLMPMAYEIGREYSLNFYPYTQYVTDYIYDKEPFGTVAAAMRKGEWDAAKNLLQLLLDSPDPKVVKRAKHNMEVVEKAIYRQKGDFEHIVRIP